MPEIPIMKTVFIQDITEDEIDLIRKRLRQEMTLEELNEKMTFDRKCELTSAKIHRYGAGMSWLDVRVTAWELNNGIGTHVDRCSLWPNFAAQLLAKP